MRITLFDAISERLTQIVMVDGLPQFQPDAGQRKGKKPVITDFDLWNENIDQLTKGRIFPTPSVMIEFDPIQWQYLGKRVRRADVIVRLHIITGTLATAEVGNKHQDKALFRFMLIRAINEALIGFCGATDRQSFGTFRYYESHTDHNHAKLRNDIECWQVACIDATGVPKPKMTAAQLSLRTAQQ